MNCFKWRAPQVLKEVAEVQRGLIEIALPLPSSFAYHDSTPALWGPGCGPSWWRSRGPNSIMQNMNYILYRSHISIIYCLYYISLMYNVSGQSDYKEPPWCTWSSAQLVEPARPSPRPGLAHGLGGLEAVQAGRAAPRIKPIPCFRTVQQEIISH